MGTTMAVESAAEPASGRFTVALLGLESNPEGPALVTQALERMPGVARIYFNRDTEMVYVEYRESMVTPGRLLAAVEQTGHSVGDITVRSVAPGEAFPSEAERQAPVEAQEGFVALDRSCCGPTTSAASVPGVSVPALPARDGTTTEGTAPATRAAESQPGGWPFRVRLSLFLAAVVAVLAPALWLIRPMPTNAMGADYNVDMTMTGFTPPNLNVPAGRPVSIQFNNMDSPFHGITNGALHQFAIDELGIDVRLDGKQSTMINLPAMEPGTYQFYCNVCCGGKVNPSMRGTITVRGTELTQTMEEVAKR